MLPRRKTRAPLMLTLIGLIGVAASTIGSTGTVSALIGGSATRQDTARPQSLAGGGAANLAVWRPSSGTWFVRNVSTIQWGQGGDIPAPGHYFP